MFFKYNKIAPNKLLVFNLLLLVYNWSNRTLLQINFTNEMDNKRKAKDRPHCMSVAY